MHWGQHTLVLRQIAALEQSGMPLARCVSTCRDAASSARLRKQLTATHKRLLAGDSVSSALEHGQLVPADQIGLIAVAEKVDATSEALEFAAEVMTLRHRLATAARGVLAYPLLLLVLAGVLALFGRLVLGEALEATQYGEAGFSTLRAASPVLVPMGIASIALGMGGLAWLAVGRIPAGVIRVPLVGHAIRRAALADVLSVAAAASGRSAPLSRAIAQMPVFPRADRLASALAEGVLLEDALLRAGLATEDEIDDLDASDARSLARETAESLERYVHRLAAGLTIGLGLVFYLWMYRALAHPILSLKTLLF